MTTIIRRSPKPRRALPIALLLAALLALAIVAGVLALAWGRGGPQPVHEIDGPVTVSGAASAVKSGGI